MRGRLLTSLILFFVAFAGCTDDPDADDGTGTGGSGDGTNDGNDGTGSSQGTSYSKGDALSTITFSDSGEVTTAVTQPDCEGGSGVTEVFNWNIPASNADGVPWEAKTLTVSITKNAQTLTDLDLHLIEDDTTLGSSTERGPDQEDVSVTVSDVSPGNLSIRVQVCTSGVGEFDVDGTADMVASADHTVSAS